MRRLLLLFRAAAAAARLPHARLYAGRGGGGPGDHVRPPLLRPRQRNPGGIRHQPARPVQSLWRGSPGEDLYPEAVKTLARIRNEAELGFQWKHPVPVARLPRLAAAPRIDGTPEAAEWRDALRFSGEFVMNRNGEDAAIPPLSLAGGLARRPPLCRRAFPG
ncbi:MAG: hypothetical protein L6W00_13685 [Lentisphaeria bacterium]|nr:MAG: hypothetical protein L6W00_13685 [Lentisphaeria bacterium]